MTSRLFALPLIAVLALVALVVIVVSANLLVSSLGLGHKNADFTTDKVHTLSDGTKGILKELDDRKLLQIVLMGQPELRNRMISPVNC